MVEQQFPVIEVSGSPYERGRSHGEMCKELVSGAISAHFDFLRDAFARTTGISLARKDVVAVSDRYVPAAENYCPDLVEEVRGIADGAGIPFDEVFSLNCFIDVADLVRPALMPNLLFGCTTFGVYDMHDNTGNAFIGQTFDTKDALQDFVIGLKVSGSGLPTAVLPTFAGVVGCAGLNEYGVAVCINHLEASDTRPGVPYPFVVRKILEQVGLADAISVAVNCERACGTNYLLADSTPEMFSLETSAGQHEVIYAFDGYTCHANHYLSMRLKPFEKYSQGSSIVRFSRGYKLARQASKSEDSLEALMALSRDHGGRPSSICVHPDERKPPLQRYSTCFGVVIDIQNRTLWMTAGNPCKSEYVPLAI